MTLSFSIRRPDDFHAHFRDNALTSLVVEHTAQNFARSVAMPNLVPPVATVDHAGAYRDKLLNARPENSAWQPLMTLYLTTETTPAEIKKAKESEFVLGVKYYPAHATTNSQHGLTDIFQARDVLEEMQKQDLPLLIHGEVVGDGIDIFDREALFIEKVSSKLVREFPVLRIIQEHITTREAAEFVSQSRAGVAATITPQHLLFNRNAMLVGGVRPHYYCLPILKREEHRVALTQAAVSDSGKFFAGTDSAPHARDTKENACGCAGCYTAFHAPSLYAEAFDRAGDLSKPETQKIFERFMSEHGARFYQLPLNDGRMTFTRAPLQVPKVFDYSGGQLVPFLAEQSLAWSSKLISL